MSLVEKWKKKGAFSIGLPKIHLDSSNPHMLVSYLGGEWELLRYKLDQLWLVE